MLTILRGRDVKMLLHDYGSVMTQYVYWSRVVTRVFRVVIIYIK